MSIAKCAGFLFIFVLLFSSSISAHRPIAFARQEIPIDLETELSLLHGRMPDFICTSIRIFLEYRDKRQFDSQFLALQMAVNQDMKDVRTCSIPVCPFGVYNLVLTFVNDSKVEQRTLLIRDMLVTSIEHVWVTDGVWNFRFCSKCFNLRLEEFVLVAYRFDLTTNTWKAIHRVEPILYSITDQHTLSVRLSRKLLVYSPGEIRWQLLKRDIDAAQENTECYVVVYDFMPSADFSRQYSFSPIIVSCEDELVLAGNNSLLRIITIGDGKNSQLPEISFTNDNRFDFKPFPCKLLHYSPSASIYTFTVANFMSTSGFYGTIQVKQPTATETVTGYAHFYFTKDTFLSLNLYHQLIIDVKESCVWDSFQLDLVRVCVEDDQSFHYLADTKTFYGFFPTTIDALHLPPLKTLGYKLSEREGLYKYVLKTRWLSNEDWTILGISKSFFILHRSVASDALTDWIVREEPAHQLALPEDTILLDYNIQRYTSPTREETLLEDYYFE